MVTSLESSGKISKRSSTFFCIEKNTQFCVLKLLSMSQAGVCELPLPSRYSGGLCFIMENATLGFFSAVSL